MRIENAMFGMGRDKEMGGEGWRMEFNGFCNVLNKKRSSFDSVACVCVCEIQLKSTDAPMPSNFLLVLISTLHSNETIFFFFFFFKKIIFKPSTW